MGNKKEAGNAIRSGSTRMYTLSEIAKIKGCSKQSVHQMARRKKIPGFWLGPMRYFTAREMSRLINSVAIGGQKDGGRTTKRPRSATTTATTTAAVS